jgi:hypothetical protein
MSNPDWKEGIDASEVLMDMPVYPWQIYEPQSRKTGEIGLAIAVIQHAMHEYAVFSIQTSHRADRLTHEAKEWLLSQERGWPFSFLNLCDYVGIDADAFQREFRRIAHAKDSPASSPEIPEKECPIR